MHGERKVRGGKLVVVDATVSAGRLIDVVLSGDFFLEPDEALGWLTAALEGQSADASLDELTASLDDAALEADLVGFGTRDVALAVLRALGRATTWDDLELEIVRTGPLEPAMQMALDEVIARQVAEGRRAPNLRFWDWASSAVVIGSYQSLANEVDAAAAERHGIEVVRRISGGGAMFIEPGNTITYSLAVPDTLVAGMTFQESYAFLDEWVLRGLRTVGIEAAYSGLNDIASPVGKIAGAAQKRVPGGVLHHVTMAYDIDADKMLEVLRIGREKMSDKGTRSASKRVDPIRSQTGLTREKVIEALLSEFEESFAATYVGLDQATIDEAAALVATKHGTREWRSRVP
ncbi:lipoate-protein ligase A [Nocardioides albertanoniae]|uniref:Lipoate-protein ligase A n=1 Tax=Nocardioides albertanoniae TaxID=1175486 RepID=A0A543A508_9ACTN|nr:lipoate-protein ligase A [Nocardioides albertanoniae]